MYAHWPAIAIDSAGTVYLVWDTDNRQLGTSGGCSAAPTPAPNSIMLVSTKDLGTTWTAPAAVSHPGDARVFWPWIAAGDAGKVSIIWYQTEPQDRA
jgi:Neuraminidase (sialidase)